MSKKLSMDKDELVKEHKHLVKVLKSKSHKDDMKEAKKQDKELKEYEGKSDKKEDRKEKHESKESPAKEMKEKKASPGKEGREKAMFKKDSHVKSDTEHEDSRDHKHLDYDSYNRGK